MDTSQKRGPGRPPRKHNTSIPCRGILDKPDNEMNFIELTYHDPTIFRYIFTTFKNLRVRDIYFRFKPDSLTLFAKDHLNNFLAVDIKCENLSNYYCKSEIFLCVNENNLQKIFLNIHKSIDKVSITYEECEENITIILNDLVLGKEKNYFVSVSNIEPGYNYSEIEKFIKEVDVRLSFSLSVKDFKETISDALHYGDKISIEKHGCAEMEIKFEKVCTDICIERYKDNDKINLISNIPDDESFRCCLHTITIKAITNSIINNSINIKCLDQNQAIFIIKILDIITLTIYAETN
jgi:hypothetical protein